MTKNSATKTLKKLENSEVELAPIDQQTAAIIKKAARATGSNAMSVIHEAIQLFEKSLGRQVTVKENDSSWNLEINKYTKYKTVTDLEPK